jgi:hypothetical protein
VREDGADADGLQDAVFLGVHALEGVVIVVVVAKAVEGAVENVKEELALDGDGSGRGLAAGLIHAGEDVNIEGFAPRSLALGEIKGQDVCRAWDFGELQMGGGHFGVGNEADAHFTGAAKSSDGGAGLGTER